MAEIIEVLKDILFYVIEICTAGLEFAGIIVLVSTAFICFVKWVRRDRENIRLDLAQGIALRAAMTFLIHWEIVNEKKEMKEAAKARAAVKRANRQKASASGSAQSGSEEADYYQEVEMTYEDNFRRPSLGHHAPNDDE